MRTSEWIAFSFFVWLVVAATARSLPAGRRLRLVAASLLMCGVVLAVARSVPSPARDWVPALYILAGYFQSGWLFAAPSPRFEAWLASWDRRMLGDSISKASRWPGWLLTYLDVVYIFCFLMVPAGLGVVLASGTPGAVDRFWTIVLTAEFGSFAPLAILQSRPPWALEPLSWNRTRTSRFASLFVSRATIGANTFPSGHVAASLAVALTAFDASILAGFILLVLALSIAAACIVGRYHYVMDVVAGGLLAAVAWATVML